MAVDSSDCGNERKEGKHSSVAVNARWGRGVVCVSENSGNSFKGRLLVT